MRVHITVMNNGIGVAQNVQEDVGKIVSESGWHEMGLFRYETSTDTDIELRKRIDGVISSLSSEDIVVFQYPSWNGRRYDIELVNRLKIYGNKLIIFVHDLSSILWENMGTNGENLISEIELLNRADLLILASSKLHEFLRGYGLREMPVVYQKIWELSTDMVITHHSPIRRMVFTSGDDISFYAGENPIHQFSYEDKTRGNSNVKWCGFLDTYSLLMELARGGFGLVWTDDRQMERYDCMNQPYKIAGYLAAGIPVFLRKGYIHEKFVMENGLGYVITSLEEADEILGNLSEEEYLRKYENVKRIQSLLTNGFFTRRTLIDAVIRVLDFSD